MKTFLYASAAMLLFAAAPAQAADCDNAGTQIELDRCAMQEYQAADDQLNNVYTQVMAQAADKEALRQSERDWIKFRDSSCEQETADSEGGSMHPMLVSQCMAEKTRARTRELRKQMN